MKEKTDLTQYLKEINKEQWLPVYGVYATIRDFYQRRPSLIGQRGKDLTERTERTPLPIFLGTAMYHGILLNLVANTMDPLIDKIF